MSFFARGERASRPLEARRETRAGENARSPLVLALLAVALATSSLRIAAQEPKPVKILSSYLGDREGVELNFAWRYAPGDGPNRQSPQLDDSRWSTASPLIQDPAGWSGVAWFRRHLIIDPSLQNRPVAIRVIAPGLATVYLDGNLVVGGQQPGAPQSGAPREVPSDHRDACVVAFRGGPHVLAVRYEYPPHAARPPSGIGFHLSLAQPGLLPSSAAPRPWILTARGGILALPIFLALLHLALFAFDRRARENLFYAGEMIAFAAILVHEYRSNIFPTEAQQQFVDRLSSGIAIPAILFGLLTYYAVRHERMPRSWRLFVATAVVLFITAYIAPSEYLWIAYFVAMCIEIIRLERRGTTRKREGTQLFVRTFAIFGLAILLQILVNFGVLDSIAGVHEVYIFGLFASAVGMSLYLARTLGQSRVIEAENARKTAELTQARDLQLSMLPRELPELAGLDVAVTTLTAAEVGGDYYDVRAAGDSLLFAFGDATGHGLASGIVVTAAKALFTSMPEDESVTDQLARCDQALRAMQLATLRMCLAIARISRTEVAIASAAMPPLLIHRASTGRVEELGAGGLPLGSRLQSRYEERRATLAAGDTLLFASDGFAELSDSKGKQLGYDGACNAFRAAADAGSVRDVVERLVGHAARFRGAHAQDDDITLLVVRVGPSSSRA